MATYDFTIKQGDTLPPLAMQLRYSTSQQPDLTGATVKLKYRKRRTTTQSAGQVTTRTATVVQAATGQVRYDWAAGDTDQAGLYDMEMEVTFPGGKVETFPNGSMLSLYIPGDLDHPST